MNATRAAVPRISDRGIRPGQAVPPSRAKGIARMSLRPVTMPVPPRPRLLHVFQTLPGMLAVMVALVAGAIGSPRCGRGGDPNTRRLSERDARFPVRPGDDGI